MSINTLSIRFTRGSFIANTWKCEINLWQLQNEMQYKIYRWRKKHESIFGHWNIHLQHF